MIVRIARTAWRNLLFLLFGFEPYYPASRWNKTYLDGYHLDAGDQDGRYGALVSLLQRYDHGLPVLDVGCGEGLLAQQLRKVCLPRIVGVDYSEAAVKLAISRNIPDSTFICSDYRKCDLAEKFGAIIFNESLYYINDIIPVMEKLSRSLAADGVFIISMFDAFSNRRIWRTVLGHYRLVRSILVLDETYGKRWHIRVLQPRQSQADG